MIVSKRKVIIFLLIIIIIAAFFRLWQLNTAPPGLYPDEAINGNDALISLQTHNFKVFYPENNGREGLFIWLIAFSFWLFKPSIWAFRIVPSIFGILTVLGLYLLTKELFFRYRQDQNQARFVALLASFFLAISFWHINFSRIGFRAILVPFFLVFGFYFLFKGFRPKKHSNIVLILSGLFLGLGFYTYIAYRFVVLLLAIVLICQYLIAQKQKEKKQFFRSATYLLFSIFITALPIGIYFLKYPAQFFGRAAGVSILSQPNPISNFGKSLLDHLAMFILRGDGNWRHNFAGAPELLWPVGILFFIGIVFLIKDLLLLKKEKNIFKFQIANFIISWFVVMLLPGFLSAEGIPHSLRVIGVVPVVYICAALGACWIFEKIKIFSRIRQQKAIFYFSLLILFFSIAYAQFDKYFFQWAKKQEVKGAFAANYVKIGRYLNSLPDNIEKYVVVNQDGVPVPYPNGIPMPAQTPMLIERIKFGKTRAVYLLPNNLDKIKMDRKAVIIPLQPDPNLFTALYSKFPRGKIQNQNGITFYKIEK
jgi:4-amino-4-deoxy-L-arabinose transferase-like glycosyltransferase